MERIYTFDKKQYRYKVVYIGWIMVAILAYSLFRLATAPSILFLAAAFLSAYGCANTYLTKSNPREIVISDEAITFRSYGEKSFRTAEITRFRVRVSTAGYQVFVRVRDSSGHRGWFWVNYALFSDKEDLLKEFDYLERKAHPDSLRMSGHPEMGVYRPKQQLQT